MSALRVPPGRAGRLWLRHRLATAERAATLLEQKLRALRAEQTRFDRQAQASGQLWEQLAAQARQWLLWAALAGGRRGVRLASGGQPAVVTVTWETVMGVRYPADATCGWPPVAEGGPVILGGAAVVQALRAHRMALAAAVRHAAALAAQRAVTAEVAATGQRVRSLRQHWIPRLQQALTVAELQLEEQERDEAVRHRWSAEHGAR